MINQSKISMKFSFHEFGEKKSFRMTLSKPNEDKQNEKSKNKGGKSFFLEGIESRYLEKKYFSFSLEFKFSLFRNYYPFNVTKI
jgi:hypothetical protein